MTYFRARMRTIIGVLPFHGPVRDGKGWCRQAMVVRRRGESESSRPRWWARAEGKGGWFVSVQRKVMGSSRTGD